ncbi:Hypothetical predicted protein [Pelobates cultripes]|uniref:Uncharacterized protein n=1 Tax=Pelobates cultripes TaxID=61616 RepID=A0AAD1WE89_PELCU|nr:Hypothetical predicted protein [Pelobates cultripes]
MHMKNPAPDPQTHFLTHFEKRLIAGAPAKGPISAIYTLLNTNTELCHLPWAKAWETDIGCQIPENTWLKAINSYKGSGELRNAHRLYNKTPTLETGGLGELDQKSHRLEDRGEYTRTYRDTDIKSIAKRHETETGNTGMNPRCDSDGPH